MSFMANAGAARQWQSRRRSSGAAGVGSKAPQPLTEAKDNPSIVPPEPTKRPLSPKQGARPAASALVGTAAAVPVAVPTMPVIATAPAKPAAPTKPAAPVASVAPAAPAAPAAPIPPAEPTVPPAPAAPTLRAAPPATIPVATLSTAPPAFPAPPPVAPSSALAQFPAPPSAPRERTHAAAAGLPSSSSSTGGLPASDEARLAHMRREAQRFSAAMEEQLLGTRKLVLRIGGAQKLPPPKPVDGSAPTKLKPYVVVRRDRTRTRDAHPRCTPKMHTRDAKPIAHAQLPVHCLRCLHCLHCLHCLRCLYTAGARRRPHGAQDRAAWSRA